VFTLCVSFIILFTGNPSSLLLQVTLAAKYGAKAAILYSDPYDSSSPTDNSSYPDSWWLPSTGVQRGTVKGVDGDPTTPMYPSLGTL